MSPRRGVQPPASPELQTQLPISLPAAAAPERIAVEVSTPCAAPFDGDDWLFTVDWEGSRCLLVADGAGTVRLQGVTGPMDDRHRSVVSGSRLPPDRAMVVDGAVCVLDREGRPDLAALAAIGAGGRADRAVFVATDLLQLDGRPLVARPLLARLAALVEVIRPGSTLQVPDHVVGNGTAFAAAAAERGLAAILARRQTAPYRAGVASPDRLRVALSGRREAVVVGRRAAGSRVELVLGEWSDGRLVAAGVVALEGSGAARRQLGAATVSDRPVIGGAPRPGVTWLVPRLVATVEPVAGSGRLRLVAVRDDVDPLWCVRRPAVPPPAAGSVSGSRAFSPTVLTGLPLDGAA